MTVKSVESILLTLVVYPLLEEAVFRWGLLRWLDQRSRGGGLTVNNIATSVAFSAAHVGHWGAWHAIGVFFPSLVLGAVWQRWHSFWLCFTVHSTFNLINLARQELGFASLTDVMRAASSVRVH